VHYNYDILNGDSAMFFIGCIQRSDICVIYQHAILKDMRTYNSMHL